MIQIKRFTFNAFQVNCYLLFDENKNGIIIDPCCETDAERTELITFVSANNITPKLLLNTHGHVDHILGNNFVSNIYKLPIQMHADDLFLFETALEHGTLFGLQVEQPELPTHYIADNAIISTGNIQLKSIHVPGHSPGSLAFYEEQEQIVICGDVLFNGSIGRSDLPRGNYSQLINSIKTKLLCLNGKTTVYPGHGPETTIGFEKSNNPFLN